jgi:hypothetical protein
MILKTKCMNGRVSLIVNYYGAKEFELVYCLVDIPEALIKDEERKLLYKFGTINENSNEYKNAREDLRNTFLISNKMELKSRVIRYKFE